MLIFGVCLIFLGGLVFIFALFRKPPNNFQETLPTPKEYVIWEYEKGEKINITTNSFKIGDICMVKGWKYFDDFILIKCCSCNGTGLSNRNYPKRVDEKCGLIPCSACGDPQEKLNYTEVKVV